MPYKVVQTIEKGRMCYSAVPAGWESGGVLLWPPPSVAPRVLARLLHDERHAPRAGWQRVPCVVRGVRGGYSEAVDAAEELETAEDAGQRGPRGGAGARQGQLDMSVEAMDSKKKVLCLLDKVLENQNSIFNELATHNVLYQEILDKLNTPPIVVPNQREPAAEAEPYPPVRAPDELKQLEDNLNDPEFQRNYISYMTNIWSHQTGLKGMNLCYKLVDFFFSREFLLQCSWTGNTRDDDKAEKTGLKFFKKVRYTFFKIANMSDASITQLDIDLFLKRVIKNSKQRFEATFKTTGRDSRTKNRPSKGLKREPVAAEDGEGEASGSGEEPAGSGGEPAGSGGEPAGSGDEGEMEDQ